MKKVFVITLLAVGSVALAASLSVPWFVDSPNAAIGGNPPGEAVGLVALHNNLSDPISCSIKYFAADGTPLTGGDTTDRLYVLGAAGVANTFIIPGDSTVQFRPVADDPSGAVPTDVHPDGDSSGQESATGVVVPNRPRFTSAASAFTNKANGALVVSWIVGGDVTVSSVQGRYTEVGAGASIGYLLPGGS